MAKGKLHDGWVEDAAFVDGSLWLPVQDDGAVWQVDGNAKVVRSVPTGSKPYAVGRGNGEIFVANQNSGTVTRIDTRTGRTRSGRTGHMPNSAAVAGGLVWVSLSPSAADARSGLDPAKTVRIVTQGDPWFNTDPAIAAPPEQFQLHRAIGARLLRHPDGPQPRQGQLLPEIADLPRVSDGGRTYTFRIRPGYRFSPPSGAPVTAEVMRATVERAMSPVLVGNNADPSLAITDLVGLDAYRKGRADHISGIRVEGDELSFTLKRPAPDFPARISSPWFSAVPLGTPVLPHGIPQALPSAGPYYIESHIGDTQEVLKRNPYYKGPRPHQVEAFLVSNDIGENRAVDLVTAGKADVAAIAPPQSSGGAPHAWQPGGELDQRYGGEATGEAHLLFAPVPSVRFVAFNTRRGLFRDPVLRRAVALALDREALAAVAGERPWDSMVGVAMPGAPDADAPVAEPDLARAKALARGRGGRALMFINTPDRCSECAARGALLAKQLAPLGIRVKVKADQRAPGGFFDPGLPADLILMGWIYDWPDPSNTLNAMFDRDRPLGYGFPVVDELFDDPSAARSLRAAYATGGPARDAAYRRADERLLHGAAPVVPLRPQRPADPAELTRGLRERRPAGLRPAQPRRALPQVGTAVAASSICRGSSPSGQR